MIRSLPSWFDALDMATLVNRLEFDELLTVIQANL